MYHNEKDLRVIKPFAKRILEYRLLEPARWLQRQVNRPLGFVDRDIATRYLAQSEEPKLHIGCGDHGLAGWLNTDFFPASRDIVFLDATRPLPFKDETFAYVFSEHMIEHIPYGDGLTLLAECYRVLIPGGKIRISTPDLAFVIDLARTDKSELQRAYIEWMSHEYIGNVQGDKAGFVINYFVRGWGHTFIYDESTLRGAMTAAGFTEIVRCGLLESDHAALRNLENEARLPPGFLRLETFTLEGSK
jgi:predicted SAM-dependent methyltransferase